MDSTQSWTIWRGEDHSPFHVGIDDRVTLTEVNLDQKAVSAVPFFTTAVAYDANFPPQRDPPHD